MHEPTRYEIVIRGRASPRLLRPLADDFAVDRSTDGVTRLVGDISDASHLHGVLAHLTSVNAEVISLAVLDERQPGPTDPSTPSASPDPASGAPS